MSPFTLLSAITPPKYSFVCRMRIHDPRFYPTNPPKSKCLLPFIDAENKCVIRCSPFLVIWYHCGRFSEKDSSGGPQRDAGIEIVDPTVWHEIEIRSDFHQLGVCICKRFSSIRH